MEMEKRKTSTEEAEKETIKTELNEGDVLNEVAVDQPLKDQFSKLTDSLEQFVTD